MSHETELRRVAGNLARSGQGSEAMTRTDHLRNVILERIGKHAIAEHDAIQKGGASVDDAVQARLLRDELMEVMRESLRRADNGNGNG
jgi:hypothetical protein